jgi:hypothetical protein
MSITDEHKKRVIDVVTEKQLSSIMNNTKWERLQSAVLNTLSFPPPYQAKYVLSEIPSPEHFESDVWYFGDWIEGITPFYSVEWIRVRPRYLRHQGKLLKPEVIDISKEFLSILRDLRIPYRLDNDSYFIYGYIADPGQLILGNSPSNS